MILKSNYITLNERQAGVGNSGYGINPECRFLADSVEKLSNVTGP